jgi:DNA-binding NarL/FixJ family response regulator
MLTNDLAYALAGASDATLPPPGRAPLLEPEVLDAGAIWASLCAGREVVTASFCTSSECHLELECVSTPVPLGAAYRTVLDLLLRGEAQKFIALETDCAPSTIALRARRAVALLGLRCAPGALPTSLIQIAQVAWGNLPGLIGRSRPVPENPSRRLISIARLDPRGLGLFSAAEAHIVDLLIDARSRKDMAELRRSAPRTIANQLAQVYRKVRITGRIPLLIHIMRANAHAAPEAPMLMGWSGFFSVSEPTMHENDATVYRLK